MSATNRHITYPRCKTKNRWSSVKAHAMNGVVTVLLTLLPIKAAKTSVMHNNDQVTGELQYLQHHKSLRSVDTHFNVLLIEHLVPSIIVFILIWLDRLSLCLNETQPCGKAEQHNYLALFTHTGRKMMYHAKRFIAAAIHLFMNQYSQATSYHFPIIYL